MMSMCRVMSCVVGKVCLLWAVCSLDNSLLVFDLHSVLQSQTCLVLQVSLDCLLFHSNLLWWKGHLFFFSVASRRSCKSRGWNPYCIRREELFFNLHPWSIQLGVLHIVLCAVHNCSQRKVRMHVCLEGRSRQEGREKWRLVMRHAWQESHPRWVQVHHIIIL